jgi:hypothetical protein
VLYRLGSLTCVVAGETIASQGETGVTNMGRLFVVGALVASASLALMASSAASAPLVDRFHGTISVTFPDKVCGIDGTTA